jgi:hypothetical protein
MRAIGRSSIAAAILSHTSQISTAPTNRIPVLTANHYLTHLIPPLGRPTASSNLDSSGYPISEHKSEFHRRHPTSRPPQSLTESGEP